MLIPSFLVDTPFCSAIDPAKDCDILSLYIKPVKQNALIALYLLAPSDAENLIKFR